MVVTKKETYLKQLTDTKADINSKEVVRKLGELGICLGEHPYKLYGVTYDGNGNEVCVFLNAFTTYSEAEIEPIYDEQYHERYVEVEEDY